MRRDEGEGGAKGGSVKTALAKVGLLFVIGSVAEWALTGPQTVSASQESIRVAMSAPAGAEAAWRGPVAALVIGLIIGAAIVAVIFWGTGWQFDRVYGARADARRAEHEAAVEEAAAEQV